jgi:GTPase
VLLVVDVREGVTPIDSDIADHLRRARTPVVLAANKSDGRQSEALAAEFYRLGLGEPRPVSALHGTGSGELLDAVLQVMPEATPEPEGERVAARIAILGRPNVGKSSLVNSVTKDQRSLVTSTPGTTRDPVDTEMVVEGKRVILVDTAGIRRPGLTRGVEQYSLLRGLRAMERSDVALVMMDARDGITAQDQHIAGYVTEAGRGLVLVVNKWDLLTTDEKEEKEWRSRLRRAFDFAPWARVTYVSALTGQRVVQPIEVALGVVAERRRRIATPELNRWLRGILARRDPPTRKGKRLKVLYATQAEATTPTFVFFVNDPELVHFSYRRFLETQLRAAFGFEGTPIRLVFRRRGEEP